MGKVGLVLLRLSPYVGLSNIEFRCSRQHGPRSLSGLF